MALSPRARATALGSVAIGLWSTLALLGTLASGVPPFQLVAAAFVVASAVGAILVAARGRRGRSRLRQPAAAWLLAVAGLFGFHFFYFVGLARAPAVEASLITYLWPLLIVVFAALLPGERLRRPQALGALLGLAGCFLLVTGGGRLRLEPQHLSGYLAALAAAVIWAGYSVLNRRWADAPTEAVTASCATTALLAAACHAAFETWVAPTPAQWLAIVLLGAGPLGAAFFAWDHGTKRGDLPTLGALSYATPLASTALLILAGEAEATWAVAVACLLIVGGAVLASGDLLSRRSVETG